MEDEQWQIFKVAAIAILAGCIAAAFFAGYLAHHWLHALPAPPDAG